MRKWFGVRFCENDNLVEDFIFGFAGLDLSEIKRLQSITNMFQNNKILSVSLMGGKSVVFEGTKENMKVCLKQGYKKAQTVAKMELQKKSFLSILDSILDLKFNPLCGHFQQDMENIKPKFNNVSMSIIT